MAKRTRRSRVRGGAPAADGPAYPPQHGNCYKALEWVNQNGEPTYFGMYSNDQPEPMHPERANAGGVDARGWFTIEGEQSVRRHYYRDSLRVVPCQDGESDVEMDGGRRRRRGRKSRRISKKRIIR